MQGSQHMEGRVAVAECTAPVFQPPVSALLPSDIAAHPRDLEA